MIIHTHPTGNFNARLTAKTLYDLNFLKEFHTSLSLPDNHPLVNFVGGKIRAEYSRRVFNEIPQSFQVSHPYRELLRLLSSKIGIINSFKSDSHPLSIFSIYKSFDLQVARRLNYPCSIKAVYSYEDGAKETFIKAKDLGLKCIYELPIGYWENALRVFEEEREYSPEWVDTLPGLNDSSEKRRRKDEELELADSIIVASDFVKSTLKDSIVNRKKIFVIPYCTPPNLVFGKPSFNHGPLRVLYVGSLTQRKGLSYAIDAVEQLKDKVTFTLIGRKTTDDCQPLNQALLKHTWIESIPHNQILQQMRHHDVLLFPTLFDGFGLVITEALSQGLPIITTRNSGGPECIRHGVEGFIVPIRNSSSIVFYLDQLDQDRDLLQYMKESCIARSKVLNFNRYKSQLSKALNLILD